jgi:hypothetical protein
MCTGLHTKCPLFFPDFTTTWTVSPICEKCSNIKFHENPSRSRTVPCGQTDGQTDMSKLTAACRKFANAHKNEKYSCRWIRCFHFGSGTHPNRYAMRLDRLSERATYPLHSPPPSAHWAWYWGLSQGVVIQPSICPATSINCPSYERSELCNRMSYTPEGTYMLRQRIHLQNRGYRTQNLSRDRSHVAQGKQKQAAGQSAAQWRCGQQHADRTWKQRPHQLLKLFAVYSYYR